MNKRTIITLIFAVLLTVVATLPAFAAGDITLLNVSYDPTRELYQDFNNAFARYWQKKTGDHVIIKQSHGRFRQTGPRGHRRPGGDVVTLALAYDIDAIAAKG